MLIKMFNGWYWLWILLSVAFTLTLYFSLKNRSPKTQKTVLFIILVLGLVAHFTKFLYPPYSTDLARMGRDAWFVNICGANIGLFPFLFLSKSKTAKDYMFYLGILGGLIAVIYPMEPMLKTNQAAEWIDIARFYFHHTMLYAVPLLMVVFKLHKLDYKRVILAPVSLLVVMLFIMLNQIFQSELGFIPLRGEDMFNINYKNSSLIWGPTNDGFAVILTSVCPKIFKTIPFGQYAGQTKYWPWFWLIVPAFIYLVPVCFLMCLPFEYKHFKADYKKFVSKIWSNFTPDEDNQLSSQVAPQTDNQTKVYAYSQNLSLKDKAATAATTHLQQTTLQQPPNAKFAASTASQNHKSNLVTSDLIRMQSKIKK